MKQEYTKRLADFLRQFSAFGGELTVDRVGAAPGSVGLFPGGQEEKLLRRDILEQCLYEVTRHYTLRYRAVAGQNAQNKLEQFAHWLQQKQGALGADICIAAGKWKLTAAEGCGLYEIGLTVTATVSR